MSHLGPPREQTGKNRWISILVLLLASTSVCGSDARYVELRIDNEPYRIELARTSSERRLGLMHRKQLDRFGGMILVYPRAGDHRIWMKNMSIVLRVYWIDSDFMVIGSKRLEPCHEDPCPVYSVDKASKYVLELSDHEHGLRSGDRIYGLNDL